MAESSATTATSASGTASSTTNTAFGSREGQDWSLSRQPHRQRRRSSITMVLEAVSSALRLDDELSTLDHSRDLRTESSMLSTAPQTQDAAALSSRPSHLSPPPSPDNNASSESTVVITNIHHSPPGDGNSTLRRSSTSSEEDNDASLSTLSMYPHCGTPRKKKSIDTKTTKSDSLGMYNDDVPVGSEGSSDSVAIMKDIEQDLKNTRRLQVLYNIKTCGYTSPVLGSSRRSVEAGGNGATIRRKRAGVQRRFSAKGA